MTPTISTIYDYLNGRINIPIDLVPFIAEALDVTEQEIFDISSKTRKRCFKYFLQNSSKEELEYFQNFINFQILNNININYGEAIMSTETTDEKLKKFTELLKYAPVDFMDKILARLGEYEKLEKLDF
jgi:transcriptional regulator with XRE-family HTH domain